MSLELQVVSSLERCLLFKVSFIERGFTVYVMLQGVWRVLVSHGLMLIDSLDPVPPLCRNIMPARRAPPLDPRTKVAYICRVH